MKKMYVALGILALMATSCAEDLSSKFEEKKTAESAELFNFATTAKVNVSISYDKAYEGKAAVKIYGENPYKFVEGTPVFDNSIEPIAVGFTNESGLFSSELSLPTALKAVYVCSPTLGVTNVLYGEINGNSIRLTDADAYDPWTKTLSRASDTRSSAEMGLVDSYLTWNRYGRVSSNAYVVNIAKISGSTSKAIDRMLPNTVDNTTKDKFVTKEDFYIGKPSKLSVRFISNGGVDANSLGYYCYEGTTAPADASRLNRVVVFPSTYVKTNSMRENDAVKLMWYNPKTKNYEETFPKGYTIGFFVIDNGGTAFKDGSGISNSEYRYNAKSEFRYSDKRFNADGKSHMAAFDIADNSNTIRVFAFEDRTTAECTKCGLGDADWDYNDVIFSLQADPVDGLSDVPVVDPDPEETVITSTIKGVAAFEDLWPSKGDFDLNDVVVRYSCKVYVGDKDGKIIKTEDTYTLLWSGADLHDAFCYEMNTAASNVKSCTVTGDYTCNGQGLMNTGSADNAVFKVFDSCNTIVSNNASDTKTVTIVTEFKDRVDIADLQAPYNPFITPAANQGGKSEVHFVDYKPTCLADLAYLGTKDDMSVAASNLYYRATGDYPFAIQMPGVVDLGSFLDAKYEAVEIGTAFPKYGEWVKSKGVSNKDWYMYPAK